MRDWVDEHVARWSEELTWLDSVQEAIFVRLDVVHRHAAQVRRNARGDDGLRSWQFHVLLTLRRQGPPYSASPSHLADALGLTRGALSARRKFPARGPDRRRETGARRAAPQAGPRP